MVDSIFKMNYYMDGCVVLNPYLVVFINIMGYIVLNKEIVYCILSPHFEVYPQCVCKISYYQHTNCQHFKIKWMAALPGINNLLYLFES